MHTFCTYCSAEKDTSSGAIPAIRRYLSRRIQAVHAAAGELRLEFRILSGEFGLLAAGDPIPWYDHLLRADEVETLAVKAARQISDGGLTGLTFFTQPLRADPNTICYRDALRMACEIASVPFNIIEIDLQD